jgi:Na+-driven multidrug efflux pump
MGIRGIALATVISYVIGFFISFYFVHIRLRINFFIKNLFLHVKEVIGNILKIGIPSAVEPFSYTIQNFVVSILIINLGIVAMAANTYILRLILLDLTFSWTLTASGQIIISHYIGQNKLDKVNKTYFKIISFSMIFAFVNILLYLLFSDTLLSLFTNNLEIKNTAFYILLICLFMEPIRAINIIGGVSLKTVGDGKFSATMGIIFMWGIIPIIIFSSYFNLGIIGLWSCLLIDETIRAAINLLRWVKGNWKDKIIIKNEINENIINIQTDKVIF